MPAGLDTPFVFGAGAAVVAGFFAGATVVLGLAAAAVVAGLAEAGRVVVVVLVVTVEDFVAAGGLAVGAVDGREVRGTRLVTVVVFLTMGSTGFLVGWALRSPLARPPVGADGMRGRVGAGARIGGMVLLTTGLGAGALVPAVVLAGTLVVTPVFGLLVEGTVAATDLEGAGLGATEGVFGVTGVLGAEGLVSGGRGVVGVPVFLTGALLGVVATPGLAAEAAEARGVAVFVGLDVFVGDFLAATPTAAAPTAAPTVTAPTAATSLADNFSTT